MLLNILYFESIQSYQETTDTFKEGLQLYKIKTELVKLKFTENSSNVKNRF